MQGKFIGYEKAIELLEISAGSGKEGWRGRQILKEMGIDRKELKANVKQWNIQVKSKKKKK